MNNYDIASADRIRLKLAIAVAFGMLSRNESPDAHTVTFTEEEKLAVTAKTPGSIRREGKSRGVFA